MIRLFEIALSLVLVFIVAVVITMLLPDKGHIERSVEVASPVRQVYDSVNTFHRFPQWSTVLARDPSARIRFEGPPSGPGARVVWESADPKRSGSLEIISSIQDKQVKMALQNDWSGEDKTYTIDMQPTARGRTVNITWSYDVSYGWNLLWRFLGLYIHGEPDTMIVGYVNKVSNMLAGFPNVDYKDTEIELVEVDSQPLFLVSTRAKRLLDEVAYETDKALEKIHAAMEKAGVEPAGPVRTITTNYGNEDYFFDVAVPVNSPRFTLNGDSFTIGPRQDRSILSGGDEMDEFDDQLRGDDETAADDDANGKDGDKSDTKKKKEGPTSGSIDRQGFLVVEGDVRAVRSYGGDALMTEYTGSPASLPLLRLMLRAYAETHGYPYSEMEEGRIWDEVEQAQEAEEDGMYSPPTYRIYLPVDTDFSDGNGNGAFGGRF